MINPANGGMLEIIGILCKGLKSAGVSIVRGSRNHVITTVKLNDKLLFECSFNYFYLIFC